MVSFFNSRQTFKIFSGDITEEETCKSIFSKTIEAFGRINILINNAGVMKTGLQETTSIDQYDELMNVNVRSVVFLTQLCIPELKKTKGTVVNVSSLSGVRSFPGVGFYCMSKAALDMFTKCLALELAASGVRVNSVNPGVIVTPLQKRGGMSEEEYSVYLEKNQNFHPLGRVGDVDEVADVIAFLASSKASFMTGNITSIDGGRNLLCPR